MSTTRSPQNIGRIIRERRLKKQLTLEQTASMCGLSVRGLGKIELGDSDPKWSTMLKLSDTLDMGLKFSKIRTKRK